MIRLGLTGSIATGKSTVLAAFADLGIPVFSADAAVHQLYRSRAVEPVEQLFPGVSREGTIDRAALSRVLVAHPDRLPELEAVVHPLVREEMHRFLDHAEASGAALAVIDIPLLFESGYDYGLDAVAVTIVPDEVLRHRALARPGMSVEKLDTILARQLPQEEKRKRADYLLDTSGSVEQARMHVEKLVQTLRAGAG